ncbi:MAG: TatD family hydrolase [Lachnospiraceae bacterium]|nr:TatD family hydrolase [Lachnospiraceae bacterium]MCD7765690.1 TatD family hydrolase [Lachnospiraceae bacterium]
MIFDTHAHYNEKAFDTDRGELLSMMEPAGIAGIVNMGATLRDVEESQELAARYPFVYAAAGVHPDEVGSLDEEKLQHLYDLCGREKTVAVGEIGLDYYWDKESHDLQKEWFVRQLRMAKDTGLPVNIHSRDAAQDTFDIMKAEHAGTTGGIIHCFSSSAQMALEYVKMGYYIGVGGVVTFKNARVMKEVVAAVPLENLVTETDCPYLAPAPHRGKRNSSLYIPLVIEAIAQIKGVAPGEAEEVLYENALRVYHLK